MTKRCQGIAPRCLKKDISEKIVDYANWAFLFHEELLLAFPLQDLYFWQDPVERHDYPSNTKYFYTSCRNAYPLLNTIVAPSAQRSIFPKRPFRSGCFKPLSTVRTVALHYQQPDLLVVFRNDIFATNAFESLITDEHHYLVFHISFLTILILDNDYGLRNHALAS